MAMNVTPFVGTDNFNMETFNNMISQINSGVNGEISDVLAQLGTRAKIQTGSYVGTGTYGADNPCSLTFDFEPKLLIVGAVKGANRGWFQTNSDYGLICDGLFWVNPMPYIWNMDNYSSSLTTSYLYFTPNVTGISYYSTKGAGSQCNVSNRTYYYFGIG